MRTSKSHALRFYLGMLQEAWDDSANQKARKLNNHKHNCYHPQITSSKHILTTTILSQCMEISWFCYLLLVAPIRTIYSYHAFIIYCLLHLLKTQRPDVKKLAFWNIWRNVLRSFYNIFRVCLIPFSFYRLEEYLKQTNNNKNNNKQTSTKQEGSVKREKKVEVYIYGFCK